MALHFKRRALVLFAGLTGLLLTGCLTHMPPAAHTHMQIHWAGSWDAAAAEATRSHRPILACLVAGQIDGAC